MFLVRFSRAIFRISATQLAAEARISVRELRRIERGAARPHPSTMRALDDATRRLVLARLDHEISIE